MDSMSYLYMSGAYNDGRARDQDAPIDRLIKTLKTWARRYTQRRELARVDESMLADMGISPGHAAFEADKPFWRA